MRHTRALKDQAAARIRAHDTPLLDLAREYGVSTNTLRTWLKESDNRLRAQKDAQRVASALSVRETKIVTTQRERLLMHALEYSPATIIVTDAEGKVVYANPKFVETTGYAIEEVIGQNPRILKSGETSPDEYRQLWKTILGGKEWRGTFHNRCKDGKLYWERASISPVLDADGKITHFMAVKEDITELMETELTGRRTAATYQAVFAALPWGVMVVKSGGEILFANLAAEHLLATSLPMGSHFDQLNLRWVDCQGAAMAKTDHPIYRLLNTPQPQETETFPQENLALRMGIVPPTGGLRWVNVQLRCIAVPDQPDRCALLLIEP